MEQEQLKWVIMEWIEWEIENQSKISGWKAEWDIKEGYKVLTLILKDKTEVVFEIKL